MQNCISQARRYKAWLEKSKCVHIKSINGESRHETNFSEDYPEHDSSQVPKGKACGWL